MGGGDRAAATVLWWRTLPATSVTCFPAHDALQRDGTAVDGRRRFGNGRLLPAGPLREPESRLREVDAIVTNGDAADCAGCHDMQLLGDTFRNLTDATRVAKAEDFFGKRLHMVAGIGHPQRFFDQVRRMGLTAQEHAFPDHHPFRPEDLQIAGADAILMTEKDAVKCAR